MTAAMVARTAGKNKLIDRRGEIKFRSGIFLRLASIYAFVFPLLFLSGCGIESVNYYSPPDFAYAGNIITLRHNTDNQDFFLGYDIYYRAYYSLSEANTARGTIESATNSTSSTPESVLSTMTSTLGFKKIYLASAPTTVPTPLLAFAKGATVYYFYLPKDTSTTNWYYVTNASSTHVEILRCTGYGDSFNEPYKIDDADYGSTTNGVGTKGTIYIDAFAVAYGYDFSKLSSIYSFPASLYQPIGGSNGYTLP
jgi:hypothetical protein